MITQGDWLSAVWYLGEIDSAQYDTPPGRLIPRSIWYPGEIDSAQYDTPGRLTQRCMIPRGEWLRAVWYPGEIDPAQYDTPGRLIPRSMIPHEDFYEKFDYLWWNVNHNLKYFNTLVSGPGRFEWRWKNWRSKILLDCHFNKHIVKWTLSFPTVHILVTVWL